MKCNANSYGAPILITDRSITWYSYISSDVWSEEKAINQRPSGENFRRKQGGFSTFTTVKLGKRFWWKQRTRYQWAPARPELTLRCSSRWTTFWFWMRRGRRVGESSSAVCCHMPVAHLTCCKTLGAGSPAYRADLAALSWLQAAKKHTSFIQDLGRTMKTGLSNPAFVYVCLYWLFCLKVYIWTNQQKTDNSSLKQRAPLHTTQCILVPSYFLKLGLFTSIIIIFQTTGQAQLVSFQIKEPGSWSGLLQCYDRMESKLTAREYFYSVTKVMCRLWLHKASLNITSP